MKTFAITGTGRCGTKFLSTHMNKSTKWTVGHEPKGNPYDRFKQEYYGEVNGKLVRKPELIFPNLDVDKKGIIFRNKKTLLVSIANRKNDLTEHIKNVFWYYDTFNKWIKEDPSIVKINFEQMTTDIEYLKWIFDTFQITDVDVSKIDLKSRINHTRSPKYKTFDDLPSNWKQLYNTISEKYNF